MPREGSGPPREPVETNPCYRCRSEAGTVYFTATSGSRDRRLAERLVRAVRDRPLDAQLLANVREVHVENK